MKYPTIAMRFSDILNLRGLRARDLAEKAKMTEGAISHYVNGNRAPGIFMNFERLAKISRKPTVLAVCERFSELSK